MCSLSFCKSFTRFRYLLRCSVPDGDDEKDNVVVHTWGEDLRKMGNGYMWHDDLAKAVNGLDLDAATRMSGARFSLLLGPVARLERALTQYFLDFHVQRGYTEVSVPYLVSRSTLIGTGQLPKFEEDLFKVNHNMGGEESFLIPTAEVPITNIFRGQLLNEADFPIRLVSATPSFRAEAGSHGRDTRGLLRQHQFNKVEMVRIATPETSRDEHLAMVEDAETLLRNLELPHRRVLLCAGDMGFAARICYDLEVWLPGQQQYREVSSISNCHDFQARRMDFRYRPHDHHTLKGHNKKTKFPHTLNGSGLAVGR
jgi:seryl-tRNA synthetase